ncbi:MAG: hypothetical protein IKP86_03105 [Anaerolineaceae bacterium]|nr:hypothetical protein [Anaerolineaceae bacterium]
MEAFVNTFIPVFLLRAGILHTWIEREKIRKAEPAEVPLLWRKQVPVSCGTDKNLTVLLFSLHNCDEKGITIPI